MNNTGHALFDPVPLISPEQAKADRDSFFQMCRSAGYQAKKGRPIFTEDERAELGAEALYLMHDEGFSQSRAAIRLKIHPSTLNKILRGKTTRSRR